jgi:hypothetical protein
MTETAHGPRELIRGRRKPSRELPDISGQRRGGVGARRHCAEPADGGATCQASDRGGVKWLVRSPVSVRMRCGLPVSAGRHRPRSRSAGRRLRGRSSGRLRPGRAGCQAGVPDPSGELSISSAVRCSGWSASSPVQLAMYGTESWPVSRPGPGEHDVGDGFHDQLLKRLARPLAGALFAGDQGVPKLVHQRRHLGVDGEGVVDGDAAPAVVAEPVEACGRQARPLCKLCSVRQGRVRLRRLP